MKVDLSKFEQGDMLILRTGDDLWFTLTDYDHLLTCLKSLDGGARYLTIMVFSPDQVGINYIWKGVEFIFQPPPCKRAMSQFYGGETCSIKKVTETHTLYEVACDSI